MFIIIAALFMLLPLLSIPVTFIGYIKDNKHTVLYSLFLALGFGILAYYFQPPVRFDLFRHHLAIESMSPMTSVQLKKLLLNSYEPLALVISYFISTLRNVDLLQFSVVTAGYWMLLYMLRDYAKRNSIKTYALVLTAVFVLSSFPLVNFMSGIWNYLAMIIFCFAFYLEGKNQNNKPLAYALYAITPLIHTSMFLPISLLILFKLCSERFNKKLLFCIVIILMSLPLIHPVVSALSGITIFSQLEPMYQAYFTSGARFNYLYGGSVLIMDLLKVALYLSVAVFTYKNAKDNTKRSSSFLFLMLATILAFAPTSIALMRFVLIVQLIGFMILMEYLSSRNTRLKVFTISAMIGLSVVFASYQYFSLKNLDYGNLIPYKLLTNVAQIFRKSGN